MPNYYTGNRRLNMAEMKVNAEFIWGALEPDGWTMNAVAGMLGNMQTESYINPGIWQSLDPTHPQPWGYGLVQWTPSTKYTNWCSARGIAPEKMESALARITWELENGEQFYRTDTYPINFKQFKVSTQTPYWLGMAFLYNYERPGDLNQPNRGRQAEFWFEYLSGIVPPPPPKETRKMPIWFYLKKL